MSDTWSEAIRAHREGDFQTAEQLYNQVLKLVKDGDNLEEQAIVLDHMARLSLDKNDDHVALRRFRKLIKIQESRGDNVELSRIYRHISKIFDRKESIVEAIQYAEKALEVAEAVWNKQQRAFSHHLLGIMYQRAEMPVKSVSSLRMAQSIWEELNDSFGLYNTTMVLADIFEVQEDTPSCIKELRKGLQYLRAEENIEDSAWLHSRIAHLYLLAEDPRKALVHFLGSFGMGMRLKSPSLQKEAEMIQKIRISLGEENFWAVVSTRLRQEGAALLRKKLDEYFPPTKAEVVEVEPEVVEPPTEEEQEIDTTPDEALSEDYSHTQELPAESEEQEVSVATVAVTYEESEDVEQTEDSVFVDNASVPATPEELTSKLALVEDDIKRSFLKHFLASMGGVFLALLIAKLIVALV